MGLFSGLRYGRPNYPLYLADPYKPVEPTALEPLVPSGTRKGKDSGTTKTGKEILPEGTLAQNIDYNTTNYLIESKSRELYNRYMKLYEDDPDEWQESEEGKDISREMTTLSGIILQQKSNLPLVKANRLRWEQKQADINNPAMMAQNQYARYRPEDEIPKGKRPGDLILDENGYPITKNAANISIYGTQGYDEFGRATTLNPFTAVQGNAWVEPMEDMYTNIQSALVTWEGDKGFVGGVASAVAQIAGKIMVQSNINSDNVFAISANTVGNYLKTLTPDARESLRDTYDHLWFEDPGSLLTSVIDKKGKIDTTKEKIFMDYETWVASMIADRNQRNLVTSHRKETDYLGISGGIGFGGAASKRWTWPILAWEGSGIGGRQYKDPATGQPIPALDWKSTISDLGRLSNVPKTELIEFVKLSPLTNETQRYIIGLHENMQKLKDGYNALSKEVKEEKYNNDPSYYMTKQLFYTKDKSGNPTNILSDSGKYLSEKLDRMAKSIPVTVKKGGFGSQYMNDIQKIVRGWFGMQYSDVGVAVESNPLSFLSAEHLRKYGVSVTSTMVGPGYNDISTYHLADIKKKNIAVTTFGGKEVNFANMQFESNPLIELLNQFIYVDGHLLQVPAFMSDVLVSKNDMNNIPMSYYDASGKYIEKTYGKLSSDERKTFGIIEKKIDFSDMSAVMKEKYLNAGWTEGSIGYLIPMMTEGGGLINDLYTPSPQSGEISSTVDPRAEIIRSGQEDLENMTETK